MIRGKRNPVVHVVAYRKNPDSPIQLAVSPELLDMTEYAKGRQLITWQIDTKGFHFPADGPTIEFTSPGWEKSFAHIQVECGGRRVTAVNLNRDGLAFAYNVNVMEKETGLKAFLDPLVQNNGY